MSFDSLLIIGGGLIGSSIARAAKSRAGVSTVWMADKSADVIETIERLGIADGVAEGSAHHFASKADLIIVCVPPGKIAEVAADILPVMKAGSVLSDVGSIKGAVITAMRPHLRDDVSVIPGHPIAGTEFSGPEAGFAELFDHRWCVLTPINPDDPALPKLTAFWEALGSDVAIMDPDRHDTVLATTSHVPHLIAYTLVGTAVDMETVTGDEVVKFSAGGFRDFTRIAASDPVMWRDVFLSNREATLEVVDRFIEDLTALKRAIRWSDGETLLDHFAKTRDIRRRIVESGQDEPNFGRDD
ncbi:cyclohexadienyl dehydrogenase [Algimonas ampicilliniresistens]|uniref:Cyclohexadienyl dehydrogenase n=1 Tax=Algimonas ampicilliniresistens TaxID=1298735 RepID=A0ABQ5VD59_9PROT|nr:prephenate/arogenate dehydrogenase family protein [Algimonas ampicilliniresistens]GLQ25015.1 cyclohexadienyl dehydrogenase [Algimonas ampicilliniresistens]